MTTAADDYPLADIMWTFVIFFALMVYFWLVITALSHLFRRNDISGWGKAGWIAGILLLPLIGSLTYLITQGGRSERDVGQVHRARQQADDRLAPAAAPGSREVDEIARAKDLLDRGAINQEEFEQLKRRLLV
jgi:hypothetical protein